MIIFWKKNRRGWGKKTKIFPMNSHDKNALIGNPRKKKWHPTYKQRLAVRGRNLTVYVSLWDEWLAMSPDHVVSGCSLYGRLFVLAQWASVIRPETGDGSFFISLTVLPLFLPNKRHPSQVASASRSLLSVGDRGLIDG